jgi:hypothetical protein
MTDQPAAALSDDRKYQALVSARTPEEAVDIAAEALSPDMQILRTEVEDVSATEGKDSFVVTLWFSGGRRGAEHAGG